MKVEPSPPAWQLPAGVTRGLWDYFHHEQMAADDDAYFAGHALHAVDQAWVAECLLAVDPPTVARRPLVADLGCGVGRALLPLARLGYRGCGVDLSPSSLEVLRARAAAESLDVVCRKENLVELAGMGDASVDHALLLFSTLGMIRGRAHRRAALRQARRVLQAGGLLLLHAHNFWFNLRDPGGPWWSLGSYFSGFVSREHECGDRYFPYRGVPNVFLHAFRRRELAADLRGAGFAIDRFTPLAPKTHQPLSLPKLCGSLRACGWLVACHAR